MNLIEYSENTEQSTKKHFGVIGFLYGLVLSVIGFFAAGAGHGTYLLMGIFSAPFGLLGITAALFGAIILWLIVGLLITSSQKKILLALMAIHYGGIILTLNTETFGDQEYFNKIFLSNPSMLIFGLVVYALGQFIVWFYLLFIKAKTEKITAH